MSSWMERHWGESREWTKNIAGGLGLIKRVEQRDSH
jgi:hypothetical protein